MNSLQWSRRNWLNTVGTAGITAAGSAILLAPQYAAPARTKVAGCTRFVSRLRSIGLGRW